MLRPLVILKLGGAALTDKTQSSTLQSDTVLSNLAAYLTTAYRHLRDTGTDLILLHGAGSFGHPLAKKYGISRGINKEIYNEESDEYKEIMDGYSRTRSCVLELHAYLINLLQDLPLESVHSPDYITTSGGPLNTSHDAYNLLATKVADVLHRNRIPLLHGDAVRDSQQVCTILSADVLVRELARFFADRPQIRCVFWTDVDGVYNADPRSNPSASLIPVLRLPREKVDKDTTVGFEEGERVADVTGGMGGKVDWAKRVLTDALESGRAETLVVVIAKAGSKGGLEAVYGDLDGGGSKTIIELKL